MRRLSIIFTLVLVMTSNADIESGIRAYHQGDYETARKEFSAAAESKDPKGIHLLASLYYQGHGVPKDLDRAVALFKESAEKGYRASQANLGLMYQADSGSESISEYFSIASLSEKPASRH